MANLIAIAIGGALGAVLRYACVSLCAQLFGRGFPAGTLLVNVIGSLLVGVCYVLLVEKYQVRAFWHLGIIVGCLGGFTTFSAFSLDTLTLMQQGHTQAALANIAASVVFCLGSVWIGVSLAHRFA